MELSNGEKNLVDEFGSFSNFCGFLGHEGKIAMCPACGAILHRNLMTFYPYKTCFNCGEMLVVYPYFLAEGIWRYAKKEYKTVSFVFDEKNNYAEIKFDRELASEHFPRNWVKKEYLFPYTDYEYVKNTIVLYVEKKYEEDDSGDWFLDGLFCFCGWLSE